MHSASAVKQNQPLYSLETFFAKYTYPLGLTPPTIEIVGFLGGSCKAHHHAACQVASYAVSHKKPRVWLSMSIQPLQVDQHTCLRSQFFECILL